MKKWTKTALLTGCACCIAGAVLMFSGWASGGKAYAETYDLNAMSGSAKKEDGISTQEKIKLDDFDELQADLTIGDLNILPSGDDSCYLAWRIPSKKRRECSGISRAGRCSEHRRDKRSVRYDLH